PRDAHRSDEDEAADGRMRGEPVLAHVDAIHQTPGDHRPPVGSLNAAPRQSAEKLQFKVTFQPSGYPEEEKRQGEDNAHAARQKSVRPFPPENHLELVKAHAAIDLLVFRYLPVLVEFLLPLSGIERRDHTMNGLPFGN